MKKWEKESSFCKLNPVYFILHKMSWEFPKWTAKLPLKHEEK